MKTVAWWLSTRENPRCQATGTLWFTPSCYCAALYEYEKKEKGTVALTHRKGRLDIAQDILGFTGAAGAVKSFSRAKHVHSRRQPVHFGQRPFTPPGAQRRGLEGVTG